MTLVDQPLSEEELDAFEAYLRSDATPENCMDLSALDGFLAAIVLNPGLVLPSQWLPWVWDSENAEEEPAFRSAEEAQEITGFVMRHYNNIIGSIRAERFEPLLYELAQDDGSAFFDAEGWCEGFMLGVSAFIEPWRAVLENHAPLIGPMVLLGTKQGWKMLEESGNDKEATRQAYESIPAAVKALNAYFRPQREALVRSQTTAVGRTVRPESAKVGRNDDCPCGSGKKYKKCCGAPTLH